MYLIKAFTYPSRLILLLGTSMLFFINSPAKAQLFDMNTSYIIQNVYTDTYLSGEACSSSSPYLVHRLAVNSFEEEWSIASLGGEKYIIQNHDDANTRWIIPESPSDSGSLAISPPQPTDPIELAQLLGKHIVRYQMIQEIYFVNSLICEQDEYQLEYIDSTSNYRLLDTANNLIGTFSKGY